MEEGNKSEGGAERRFSAWQAAVGLAGSLVALGAYVYLLGGFVLWLKFTAAQLPTDDSVGVLDGNRLLAIGMKALFFEILLGGLLFGLAFLTWRGVVRGKGTKHKIHKAEQELREAAAAVRHAAGQEGSADAREDREAELEAAAVKAKEAADRPKLLAWKLLVHFLVAVIISGTLLNRLGFGPWRVIVGGLVIAMIWTLLAGATLDWFDTREQKARTDDLPRLHRLRRAGNLILAVLGFGYAIVFLAAPAGLGLMILLLFLFLSYHIKELPRVDRPAKLIPAVLFVTIGLSVVVAGYLATTPVALDNVLVVLTGDRRLEGGYVGQSSEGVFLAACQPKPNNPELSGPTVLRIVPRDRVRRVVIGGPPYVLNRAVHPSLLDIAIHLVTRRPLDQLLPTDSIDIREDKPVCGLDSTFEFGRLTRSKPGKIEQSISFFGGGTIRVYGDKIENEETHVAGQERISIPIMPDHWVIARHRCGGPFRVAVDATFTLDENGKSESQRTSAVLGANPRPTSSGAPTCSSAALGAAEPLRGSPGRRLRANAR